jgi:RND family efflux transporter MFP subunit
MIRLFIILFSFSLIAACGTESDYGDLPDNLPDLQSLQKEMRAELKTLEDELATLEKKINKMDTTTRKKLPTVPLDTLVRYDFNHYVEVQGTVQSQDEVSATSEIGGRITALYIEEGQNVSAGQVIAMTDNETLLAQKEEIESQLSLAKELFERQKQLWDREIGSEVQFLQAKNNKENLEKRLETLEVNLQKTKIRAPKSGVVDQIQLKTGEFASPGLPIAIIIDHRRLKVEMEVPENYLGKVNLGDTIALDFPNINEKKLALVSLIGNRINPRNRTFVVEARLNPGQRGLIRPNMLATALINDYSVPNVIQVPINMVQQEIGGNDFVFIKGLREDGHSVAVKKTIEVGKVYRGRAVVEKGLEEGQLLLLEGARNLRDGELFSPLK